MPHAAPHRLAPYLLINLAFALLAGVSLALSGFPDPRLPFVILLFALCSHSIIDLDGFNGRYALLALFMLIYFVSFGVGDLSNLAFGSGFLGGTPSRTAMFLDPAEAVILAGGVMLVLGYRAATYIFKADPKSRNPKDWSRVTILFSGLVLWAVGTVFTYLWYFYVVTDTNDEAFRKGLAALSPLMVTVYLIGGMCQPLGIFLLAYALSVFRTFSLLLVVATVVTFQVFIGFVIDAKGTAMLGIISVIATRVLVSGRLPKAWLAVGFIFVSLVYPYFNAYRAAIHGAGIARTAVVENFAEILRKTIAAKDEVNTGRGRATTFLERSNIKSSVEAAVAKAGNMVPYQRGYTLAPILQTFIPKILWTDKQHVPTGQLFNRQFHLVEGDEVYISPSHLGELYWNFGWPGVLLGMGMIGLLCGWVGARFNPAEGLTVTRILVTVITIKQIIIAFESTIADCYVVWFRSLAAIGVMHVLFARVPVILRYASSRTGEPTTSPDDRIQTQRLFPNLLT